MSLEKIQGYEEAVRAIEANLSPRAKHLAHLERYVEGTQYDGLPDWFSDEKPLWERAPCIVYPIAANAIESNSDLLLGEGRFPVPTVAGLEGDDAESFEKAVKEVVRQSRLAAASKEVLEAGQGCGSACAIFGIRSGRLFCESVKARWCEVQLDAEGAVTQLIIQYPYLTTEKGGDGRYTVRAKLFRRVIDNTNDTTFLPGEARQDGIEPAWIVDQTQNINHALGFCPVVWYAHRKGCTVVSDIDGKAIHERLTDEIRAHDMALSQRHRAALNAGDPQWTETGVEPGYNPTAPVRRVEMPASVSGKPGEAVTAAYVSRPARGKVRKKSPGTVWQYESKDVVVKQHTLPGDALKTLDDNARDLRLKLAESLGVVFLDPETLPSNGTLSGRALEALKARQLDRCDNYRTDFGDHFLLPALGMLLRIVSVKKLVVEGFEAVTALVAKTASSWSWHAPPLGLTWGRYFRLDPEEENKQVDTVVKARDGGVLTLRAGVEKLRSVFDIKDVDAYLLELEAEKQAAMEQQQQAAADMMAMTAPANDDGSNGAKAKPGAPARGPRGKPASPA